VVKGGSRSRAVDIVSPSIQERPTVATPRGLAPAAQNSGFQRNGRCVAGLSTRSTGQGIGPARRRGSPCLATAAPPVNWYISRDMCPGLTIVITPTGACEGHSGSTTASRSMPVLSLSESGLADGAPSTNCPSIIALFQCLHELPTACLHRWSSTWSRKSAHRVGTNEHPTANHGAHLITYIELPGAIDRGAGPSSRSLGPFL